MAILASIGNAFKTGWERTGSKKSAEEEYRGNFKYTNIYKDNITTSSFTRINENTNDGFDYKSDDHSGTPYPYVSTYYYENPFKVPLSMIREVSKNYKFIYNNEAQLVGDYGILDKGKDSNDKQIENDEVTVEVLNMPVVPSMFNPLYGINIMGITGNTPLNNLNTNEKNVQFYGSNLVPVYDDLSDCSIATLVKLSENGKLGRSTYKYADFMYCKNLGKISNNRLITLRRFPLPIGDDIWDIGEYEENTPHVKSITGDGLVPGGSTIPPDVGRLITWMDDENKLEDILKYEYKETWTEKEAHFDPQKSKEDDSSRGILGSIVNLANGSYRKSVGTGLSGGGNMILNKFAGSTRFLSASGTMSENSEAGELLGMYDKNRIYEPPGTVRKTTLYNGELEFSHSFTLTFDYELRAYENINPRTAFLDLMNNIQQVTYRQGKFWGGAVWFMGTPGNRKGWETADALMTGAFEKLDDTFNMLLRGDLNIGDLLGSLANGAAGLLKSAVKTAGDLLSSGNNETKQKAKDNLQKAITNYNINEMLEGMLKNKLGRPAVYATDSILSGNPTGLWHVTIGNPRNPILSVGNLIIENTSFQQYGPLGIDDFPTGIKVSITLKHAKPRDMVEIGKMYTMGRSGLGVSLGRTDMSKMHKSRRTGGINHNISDHLYQTAWASTSPSITGGITNAKKKDN